MQENGGSAGLPEEMKDYTDLTVTGPLGHGIRFQWLAINTDIVRLMTPPSWEEFTQYNLFKKREENTLEAFYPHGDFVLETLRKRKGFYKNVMGVTMYNEGQDEFLYSLRGIWKNVKNSVEKGYPFGNTLV